jgi:hypothetical protein
LGIELDTFPAEQQGLQPNGQTPFHARIVTIALLNTRGVTNHSSPLDTKCDDPCVTWRDDPSVTVGDDPFVAPRGCDEPLFI